jgi:hypothetical protein
MNDKSNRRKFIKVTGITGAGLLLANTVPALHSGSLKVPGHAAVFNPKANNHFIPNRVASWWTTIDDLQWPQKHIKDKIKRRAAGFAKARIDTAVNFGFHIRFDFADYFGQLHGYYADVCNELHQHGIYFMDHYSCNHISRPKNEAELRKMNTFQRHHVLLYHDVVAAKHAQYEGHLFNDVCQVDLRDGSPGYAPQYQLNTFCHSNPAYLDMHHKYLQRLINEVPLDGIMVDDMCNYAGPAVCGCNYCRERFTNQYGHAIPSFDKKEFWGDTSKEVLEWGNYENPVFRDWLRMKVDAVTDHLKMIKTTMGEKCLMTCCSNTGPLILNALSLDLEKLSPHLDLFVLENVGTNVQNTDWIKMDAEALLQKDVAAEKGNRPAMALSYTIYETGAYFGWALSRFWGVSNWSSTLNARLIEDPPDAKEMEDVISKPNNWEKKLSDLNYNNGKDVAEVRVLYSRDCKVNGWRNKDGHEHWDSVAAWTEQLVKNNVGYRFVRSAELEDANALCKENTPLIIDAVACVADQQFASIKTCLSKGGVAWLALPFGTHDEKGFVRAVPLSDQLSKSRYKNLVVVPSAVSAKPLQQLMATGKFKPIISQLKGDTGWVVRLRMYDGRPVLHFMNSALIPIPHPTLKDLSDIPVLIGLDTAIKDNDLLFEIDTSQFSIASLSLMSPELNEVKKSVKIERKGNTVRLHINLDGIKVYAVMQ